MCLIYRRKNIFINFVEDTHKNMVKFIIKDDGCGMSKEKLFKIFDPFFTTRDHKIIKLGVGLSLLKENCELTGGYVKVKSKEREGTQVEAVFKSDSIDMLPIGNLADAFLSLITFDNSIDFFIKREYNNKAYTINTKDLKELLGVSLNETAIYRELYDFIEKKEREVVKGA